MSHHSLLLRLLTILALPLAPGAAQTTSGARPFQWQLDWQFGAAGPAVHVVERSKLGSADALTVEIPLGRVVVVGTDIDAVRYTVQHASAGTVIVSTEAPDAFDTLKAGTSGTHSYRSKSIRTTMVMWDAALFPDTTAQRKLPPFLREIREITNEAGLRLVLPRPDNTVYDSMIRARSLVGSEADFLKYVDSLTGNRRDRINYGLELRIEVPRGLKHLILNSSTAATIIVQDFDGELAITNTRGDVHLGHLGGSAVVETGEGNIRGTMLQLRDNAVISLMTAKGEIKWVGPRQDLVEITSSTREGSIRRISAALPGSAADAPLPEAPAVAGRDLTNLSSYFISYPKGTDSTEKKSYVSKRNIRISLRSLSGNVSFGFLATPFPRWLR